LDKYARPAGEEQVNRRILKRRGKSVSEADADSRRVVGNPVLTHCCLEPHGTDIAVNGDKAEYWPPRKTVYGIRSGWPALNIPVANVHVHMELNGRGWIRQQVPRRFLGNSNRPSFKDRAASRLKLFLDRAY